MPSVCSDRCADMAYHKANLEHAAASEANLLQGTLLVTLLALLLLTMTGPAISVCSVHPATLVIFMAYGFGLSIFLLALSILLTSILLTGLLRREKHGIANIGFERVLILLLYLGSILAIFSGA